jgi:hypothetical protein
MKGNDSILLSVDQQQQRHRERLFPEIVLKPAFVKNCCMFVCFRLCYFNNPNFDWFKNSKKNNNPCNFINS